MSYELHPKKNSCLLINCETLNHLHSDLHLKKYILEHFGYIFFYNINEDSIELVKLITDTSLSLCQLDKNDSNYIVSDKYPDICRQISGFNFTTKETKNNICFDSSNSSIKTIIELNRKPFFIFIERSHHKFFAVAADCIIDINDTVSSNNFKISDIFSSFAPIFIFLKFYCKDEFWHPSSEYACFIIDDPLIKTKYGFLHYQSFLPVMDQYNFCTNIAFIPYNSTRTDKTIAKTISKRSDRYSISMHGCDHGECEFGICDDKRLNRKIKIALKRMQDHENYSGIQHDNTMIFPQGVFSKNALKLLKANNVLSAINTDAIAADSEKLEISAFLSPAILDYFSFPLFLRRYPVSLSDFALDLFMNRPVFIVEHHGYLKDKCKELIKFISNFNHAFEDIEWRSTDYIMKHFYIWRRNEDNIEVIIFTNSVIITNNSHQKACYRISKSEDGSIPIDKVSVNNVMHDYQIEAGRIRVELEIAPNESAEIKVIYANNFGICNENSIVYSTKIFARRMLTEIRDNYLSKNKHLTKLANTAKVLAKKVVA